MPTEAPSGTKRLGKLILTGLLFGLFILGSHPASGQLFLPPWDKVVHFIVFAILALALSAAWPRMSWLSILLLGVLIGVADEFHQIFVPTRNPGWDDALADIAGVAAGLLIWRRKPSLAG